MDDLPRRRGSKRRTTVVSLLMLAVAACVLLASLGGAALLGVAQGNNALRSTKIARDRAETELQYQQALADMQAGNYALAYERLWAVVNLNPGYPGARDALDRVVWSLQNPPTPTPTPTAAPTLEPEAPAPTAVIDPEALFAQALTANGAQNWETVVSLLDAIAGGAPTFRPDEVKEMRFNALVQLGLQRLNQNRLEEGINLLDRAALLGPLPPAAGSARALAADYLQALSYWGADWELAIASLRTLYLNVPEYRDVRQRLFQAYVAYGDSLAAIGEYCPAAPQYASALSVIYDGGVEGKRNNAQTRCANATPTPAPTVQPTVIPGALGVTVFNQANLRQGPGQSFGVLEQLGAGALLSATGRNAAGDWLFVVAPSGAQGWVFIEVVNTGGASVLGLPVTDGLPPQQPPQEEGQPPEEQPGT